MNYTSPTIIGLSYLIYKYLSQCDHNYEEILKYESTDVILDIGAYNGCSSLVASKKVTQVISLEPNPIVYNEMINKINNLQIKNIIPINIGVFNYKGLLNFRVNGYGSKILSNNLNEILIEVDTIDNILSNLNIKVNYITMDIEGSEVEALQGSIETLKNVNKIVVAAYHERIDLNGKTYTYVNKFLQDNGFTTFVDNNYLVHGWK